MSNKIVAYWLLLGAFLVISMVVLGGYTRLSHSGLSMVTWKPVTGFLPPSSDAEWLSEFERYKTSPEYIKRNYDFTLDEFKSIFWPEFLHRLLGRVLGIVFIVPFLFFLLKGYFKNRKLILNVFIIFLLGGLQGLVGWYMVKSGLVDIPAVSHYRLALHFSTALTLYVYILWVSLKLLFPNSERFQGGRIKKLLLGLLAITCLQIVYGAFVAGLKAGLIYTTYPDMDGVLIPSSVSTAITEGGVLSFFEFPALVQFVHRWMAVVVVLLVGMVYYKTKGMFLSKEQKSSVFALVGIVLLQFVLGVFTLINAVPISLGVLHQLGAVFLLTAIVCSIYFFRKPQV